ncbi:MAG: hypothetical protein QFB86_02600 [Patescibacteria group bacterium]|nr:hypothetical protein [Patescibacteria group bacterium]
MNLLTLYAKILSAYPKSFQERYADEMTQTLEDMVHDASSSPQRLKIWTAAFAELPVQITKSNFAVAGQAFSEETPGYVKRNTQLSASLLLPFVLLLMLNELRPSALPLTPSWTDIYQFLAIVLPALAFLLCATTILRWWSLGRRNHSAKMTVNIADIRHNWPLLVVSILALMIAVFMLGHDSVHCVAGNPITVVRNPTATLHCIAQD